MKKTKPKKLQKISPPPTPGGREFDLASEKDLRFLADYYGKNLKKRRRHNFL